MTLRRWSLMLGPLVLTTAAFAQMPESRRPVTSTCAPSVSADTHVLIGLVVNADGRVDPTSVTVVDSSRTPFDAEAVRVMKASTFWPACLGTKAVRVRAQFPLDYSARMGP